MTVPQIRDVHRGPAPAGKTVDGGGKMLYYIK